MARTSCSTRFRASASASSPEGQGILDGTRAVGTQAIARADGTTEHWALLSGEFDAWDIDASLEDQVWPVDILVSREVVETGPYRAALRLTWRYERSTITQVLALEAGARRLGIDCFVDWREHHTLLKAAFPLAVQADSTTAEILFGHVTRPTHRNTTLDQARFETSMQRWVDMSKHGFGVALLNDCKYGYDAIGNVLRLTLVKSPTYPWPEADQGEHQFRYAVLVHDGDVGAVNNAAEEFNALQAPPRRLPPIERYTVLRPHRRRGRGHRVHQEGRRSRCGRAAALGDARATARGGPRPRRHQLSGRRVRLA